MTVDITSPIDSFVAKLERRAVLPPDVRAAFLALPASIVQADVHDVVAEEGAESRRSLFVASGFVSRQKQANGSRQILGIGIPGDAVDLQSLWFHRQDHSIVAHKRTTLIAIDHSDIIRLCERSPHLMKALWHDTLVDAAIFREWTLNIAHRRARFRFAHLLLEVATRQKAHGLIQGDVFELPLTQGELASSLGLSLVHLNKSLRVLREQGYVQIEGRIVTLLDRPALERDTRFDPTYLHIETTPKALSANVDAGSAPPREVHNGVHVTDQDRQSETVSAASA